MNDLYVPLFLLDLTKQENQLLLALYLIYSNEDKREKYTIEEIAKLIGYTELGVENLLNKLMMRNIVGRIVYKSITDKSILDNFDEEFLATLYDKNNAFESAKKKSGFYIDSITKYYFFNPVMGSWKYIPKVGTVSKLKKLKKIMDSPFIDYLLKGFNNGKKGGNRTESHLKLNGWNIKQVIEIFRSKYRTAYGNSYDAGSRDYGHMKKLLEQLSNNAFPKNDIGLFLDYAFERAVGTDYVLQIVGLKYHANAYLTNIVKNRT